MIYEFLYGIVMAILGIAGTALVLYLLVGISAFKRDNERN